MFDTALAIVLDLVDRYGLVVLLVIFTLEGLLVGKVLPTRTLFVAVLLGLGTGVVSLAPVFVTAVIGATLGQCLLFVSIRRGGLDPGSLPFVSARHDGSSTRLEQYGPPVVGLSNVLPGVRGTLTVPVALSAVPGYKFGVWSFLGTTAYVGALVALTVVLDAGIAVALG